MPTRSGCLASVADTIDVAFSGPVAPLAPAYSTGRTFNPAAFALSTNPFSRSPVTGAPAAWPTTSTVPWPPTILAIASPASLPPARLSPRIVLSAMVGSSRTLSTRTILEPASLAALTDVTMALLSTGKITIASGFFAETAATIWVCSAASNFDGSCTSRFTPSFAASAFAPQSCEVVKSTPRSALTKAMSYFLFCDCGAAVAPELVLPSPELSLPHAVTVASTATLTTAPSVKRHCISDLL
jgi:hypothetical protein